MSRLRLNVNGVEHEIEADPDMPLLWALRDLVGLTGTKFGCGEALCGACTVHLDGMAVRSCQTPVSAAAKQKITTIEGLSAARRSPAAAGLGRAGRPAVRLLPARADHERRGPARREARSRPTRTSTPRWPATSAAAAAYQRIREAVHQAAGQTAKGGQR